MRRTYLIRRVGSSGEFAQVVGGEALEETVIYDNSAPFSPPSKTLESTDDLPEGKKNLYYTEDRVKGVVKTAVADAMKDSKDNPLKQALKEATDDLTAKLENKADLSSLNLKADAKALLDLSKKVDANEAAVANRASKDELSLGLAKKLDTETFSNQAQTFAKRSELENTVQDVRALATTVADKATKAQVTTLEAIVATKANASRLEALETQENAHYKEFSAKLETKATKDELVATNQNLATLQALTGNKASAADLTSLTTQVASNKQAAETGLAQLEAKLTGLQQAGDATLAKSIESVNDRLKGLVIPSWADVNAKLEEKVSLTTYNKDKADTAEAINNLKSAVSAEVQARTDAIRDINQSVKEGLLNTRSTLLETLSDKLADKPSASQIATDIRVAKQEITADLKAYINEKDTENDLAAQQTASTLSALRSTLDDRVSSLNEKLADRPTKDAVANMVSTAISNVPKQDVSDIRQGLATLTSRVSDHIAQNAAEHKSFVSQTDLANSTNSINSAISAQKQWANDQFENMRNTHVSKVELDSRLGLINKSMQDVDLSNLTKYATINYVQDLLRNLSIQSGGKGNIDTTLIDAQIKALTNRIAALETAKVDLSAYATKENVSQSIDTATRALDARITEIEGKLTKATTTTDGLMSSEDKAKLDNAMSRSDVITLLRSVLSIELSDQDDKVIGRLADIDKLN